MSTKGDHEGTIILYIDLEELTAKPREVTASDEWSMLKPPISDEEKQYNGTVHVNELNVAITVTTILLLLDTNTVKVTFPGRS